MCGILLIRKTDFLCKMSRAEVLELHIRRGFLSLKSSTWHAYNMWQWLHTYQEKLGLYFYAHVIDATSLSWKLFYPRKHSHQKALSLVHAPPTINGDKTVGTTHILLPGNLNYMPRRANCWNICKLRKLSSFIQFILFCILYSGFVGHWDSQIAISSGLNLYPFNIFHLVNMPILLTFFTGKYLKYIQFHNHQNKGTFLQKKMSAHFSKNFSLKSTSLYMQYMCFYSCLSKSVPLNSMKLSS